MKYLNLATIYKQSNCQSTNLHSIASNSLSSHNSNNQLSENLLSNPDESIFSIDKIDVLIDDAPINFLLDIITEQCEFTVLTEQVWQLRYFIDGPYEQILYVSFASCPASHPDILEYLPQQCFKHILKCIATPHKLVSATFIETTHYEISNDVIHYASYLESVFTR